MTDMQVKKLELLKNFYKYVKDKLDKDYLVIYQEQYIVKGLQFSNDESILYVYCYGDKFPYFLYTSISTLKNEISKYKFVNKMELQQ